MRLKMMVKHFRVGPWLGPLAVIVALAPLLGACAPIVVGAGATVGVAVAQERGLKEAVEDVKIRAQINHLFFQKSQTLFTSVNLQIHEGRVLLTGNVPSPSARLTAVRLAWQATGVRRVINEIAVGTSEVPSESGQEETSEQQPDSNTDSEAVAELSTVTESARDIWISTQLKAKILADSKVRSINYSIEAVNQEVFLMGVAQDQAELTRVIDHAKSISYVRRVVSFVRLKDQPIAAQ